MKDPRDIRVKHIDDLFNAERRSVRGTYESREANRRMGLAEAKDVTVKSLDWMRTSDDLEAVGLRNSVEAKMTVRRGEAFTQVGVDHFSPMRYANQVTRPLEPTLKQSRVYLGPAQGTVKDSFMIWNDEGKPPTFHHAASEGPSDHHLAMKGDSEHLYNLRRLRTHALMGSKLQDMESYQSVAMNSDGAPAMMWEADIDAEISKQRATVERALGRKLTAMEWRKAAKQIKGEAKEKLMAEVERLGLKDKLYRDVPVRDEAGNIVMVPRKNGAGELIRDVNTGDLIYDYKMRQPNPNRRLGHIQGDPFKTKSIRKSKYVDQFVAKQVSKKLGLPITSLDELHKAYAVGQEGPKPVYALLDHAQAWKKFDDLEGEIRNDPSAAARHVLTDAGMRELNEATETSMKFNQDADVLHAMYQDIQSSHGKQDINFENTYNAMVAGRHRDFAEAHSLKDPAGMEKYKAFEMIESFLGKNAAVPYDLPPEIMPDERNYMRDLGAHVRRARDAVARVYYRQDNRAYGSIGADVSKETRMAERQARMTPYGKLMERISELERYQSLAREEYRDLGERTRQVGPGSGEEANEFKNEFDILNEKRLSGQEIYRPQADIDAQNEQIKMDRLQEKMSGKKIGTETYTLPNGETITLDKFDGTGELSADERLVMTPHQAMVRSASEVLEGGLTEQERKNIEGWKNNFAANKDQLLAKPGDRTPHTIRQIDEARGIIHTTRAHVIAGESDIQLNIRPSDRGVTDTKRRLVEAIDLLEERRTNVDELIKDARGPLIEGKLTDAMKEEIAARAEEGKGSKLYDVSKEGFVRINRQELKDAMLDGMWIHKGTGKFKLPEWGYRSLRDRALWMLGSDGAEVIPGAFLEGIHKVVDDAKDILDFTVLAKDEHFKTRLDRLSFIEDPILRHTVAAMNRDVVNETLTNYFTETQREGAPRNYNVDSLIHEWRKSTGDMKAMPTLEEMVDVVNKTNTVLKKRGFDHLDGMADYLKKNWDDILDQDRMGNAVSLDAFGHLNATDSDMEGWQVRQDGVEVDVAPEDAALISGDRYSNEVDVESEAMNQVEKRPKSFYTMLDAIEKAHRDVTGNKGAAFKDYENAELLDKARGMMDPEHPNYAPKKFAKMFMNGDGHIEVSEALAQILSSDSRVNITDANHAKALGELINYGFEFRGKATINGQEREVALEKGTSGDVFLRDNRNYSHLIVDHKDQALGTMSARETFDTDRIWAGTIEDYRQIEAPDGHVPVALNERNVRETSRLGKGDFIPQTMAETKMHMDAVKNGATAVVMDMETTLLPNGPKDMQHILEVSMRKYDWNDDKQKLIAGEESRIFVKPSQEMRAQAKALIDKETLNSDELSYLKNLSKYARTKTAASSSSYKTEVNDAHIAQVRKDAATALKQLSSRGTHTPEEAYHHINQFTAKNIVIAQNGGKAEATWMDTMRDRIEAPGKFEPLSTDDVFDKLTYRVDWGHTEAQSAELKQFAAGIDTVFAHFHDGKIERDSLYNIAKYGDPVLTGPKTQMIEEAAGYEFDRRAIEMLTDVKHGEQKGAFADMMKLYGRDLAREAFKQDDIGSNAYDYYHDLANDDGSVKAFRPKMVELMHASRNYMDEPAMKHNMDVQMDRVHQAGNISDAAYKQFKEKAHFANADTKATAQLFESYMGAFEGYTPEFLQEGTKVAKVRMVGDDLNKGIYTVGKWLPKDNVLELLDDQGRNVRYNVAGTNSLNSLFQENFVTAPSHLDDEGKNAFLDNVKKMMDFDNARRDVQDSNSYTEFMNNYIRNKAIAEGNVNERGQTPNTPVMNYIDRGGTSSQPEKLNVTENNIQAAPHSAEYWASPEAMLKGRALGRIQDLKDLGHIDEQRAGELLSEVEEGFKAVGAETDQTRGTENLMGHIDAGMMSKEYGGNRLILAARSENELFNQLWQATKNVMPNIQSLDPIPEDERRNRAIKQIILPQLKKAELWDAAISDGTNLGSEERLGNIAKVLYNNSRKNGNMPSADIEGLRPVINSSNQDAAENTMNAIFQREAESMAPGARQAFENAAQERVRLEGELGGMVPADVRVANLPEGLDPTVSMKRRWNQEFSGMDVNEIASFLNKRTTQADVEMREKALRELNSMFNAGGDEAEAAAQALGRQQDPNVPADAPVKDRYGDVREAEMPIGKYRGRKMKDLPVDYLDYLMAGNNEPRYDSHRELIGEYLDHVDNNLLPYENPANQKAMEKMIRTGVRPEATSGAPGPAELLGRSVENAVEGDASRATIEDTASSMAFKQAVEQYPVDPNEIMQRGRAAQLLDSGAESIVKGFGKARAAGGKGLGIAALAIGGTFMLGNMLTDPSTWKRPNGDTPNPDGDYLDQPRPNMGQPTARVEDHGSGLDGLRVRVSGKSPGHMSNEQIGSMVGDGVRGSVPHQTNVQVNSRNDESKVNSEWLKQTYTDFMKNGYVN